MSKERLVELLRKKNCWYNLCASHCNKCDCVGINDEEIELLADYLLANGVIVPPCKVGDKVWFIEKGGYHYPRISHGYVQHFDVREMRGLGLTKNVVIQPIDTLEDRLYFTMFDWIGKEFLLSREEAEAKLKESESK